MKLALYKSSKGTALDKIINIGTGLYGYSHCEVVFDRMRVGQDEGKQLCFSSSPRDGKTRFNYININSGNWEIVDLDDEFTLDEEKAMFLKASEYVDKSYDYYGILFYFVFWFVRRQKENKWWCSEICSFLLGWDKFRVSPNRMARKYKAPRQKFTMKMILRKTY